MKILSGYVGILIVAASLTSACASHAVQCRGALQPINKPEAISRQSKSTPVESRP